MSDEKAETNREIALLYYQAVVDAQGYPNGMPFWHEMDASTQYHYALTGIDFIRALERGGYITFNKSIGLSDNSVWGEGDCKSHMASLQAHRDGDQKIFEERLAKIQASFSKEPPGG